ncbi:MAG TPA: PhzF family phenazine biosynthesis protein [Burkholderiaceae bacterium]|nr:PhzF family phenazine biosynthesis protein [Burkholderiaceae bacterium]
MRQYRYHTCDVFTDRLFGGNPLAVLIDARGLDDGTMQAIAREFNFSETTFVTAPANGRHTARVRIFTPGGELPFAGHPTVGTAFVLSSIGATPGASELVFEEGVGPVRVRVDRDGGRIDRCTLTTARLPERLASVGQRARLAAMLGLHAADVVGPGEAWSCGVAFTVIPLASVHALERARLDRDRWLRLLGEHEGQKVYPIARVDDNTWRVRMFAPSVGVAEDPATGSAAAALAGWLAAHEPVTSGTCCWRILQGEEIGRPSEIALEADLAGGTPSAVRVGGRCVMVGEGTLRL